MADAILDFSQWAQAAGAVGIAMFVAVYAVGTVAFVPGSILTLAAGFVWGPWWGTLIVSPASLLGASAAFALGRSVLRARVERRLADAPRLEAVDAALGERGFVIVSLLRLSPLFPFVVTNYALSLSRVSFRTYFVASALGMLPGTLAYVYAGSLVTELAALSAGVETTPATQALFWGGLIATLVLTVVLTRMARRALRTHVGAAT